MKYGIEMNAVGLNACGAHVLEDSSYIPTLGTSEYSCKFMCTALFSCCRRSAIARLAPTRSGHHNATSVAKRVPPSLGSAFHQYLVDNHAANLNLTLDILADP